MNISRPSVCPWWRARSNGDRLRKFAPYIAGLAKLLRSAGGRRDQRRRTRSCAIVGEQRLMLKVEIDISC